MPDTSDEVQTPATPRPARPTSRRRARSAVAGGRLRLAAIISAAAFGALLLAVVVDVVATQGRVQPGVSVGDVHVGSMAPQQAREALSSAFTSGSKSPVKVVFGAQRWDVTREQIGARVDDTRSIDSAMAVGRTGGVLTMIGQRLAAMFGGASVPVLVAGDPDKAAPLLDRISEAVTVAARDASITVEGTSVGLVAAESGRSLDRERTLAAITTAFVTDERTGGVVVKSVQADVGDDDARQALKDAEKLVSGPARIRYAGNATTITREQMAGLLSVSRVPVVVPAVELSSPATGSVEPTSGIYRRMSLVAGLDPVRIGRTVKTLTRGVGHAARDASFIAVGGSVRIKPSRAGQGPDLPRLAADLVRACLVSDTREATVMLAETQPKLTTEAARAMGVSDRISTYTTTYAASNQARVSNVHTLARAIDYKLIPPGGIFSFNASAGERTAAKGYQEAPAIVNGKLVPQLGGGVCQVGTTFFNTVFFAGLPVVERRNHSFYFSHYPTGRDATVSWGGPDLKFKNDTEGWLLVRTAYTNTSLTISLYGTDPGYTVKYKTGSFTSVTPHKVVEVKDAKLAKGVRIVEDIGVDGRRIAVVRTVYKGTKVVRTDTFTSTYKSKDEIVRVGTKRSSHSTTQTVSP